MADYPNPLNTKLDANQVLIRSYDESENRLRVDSKVTATIGSVDVIIDAASGDNIKISDGVDTLAVNPDGSINVIVQDITLNKNNDSVEVFQASHDNLNANANIQQNNVDVSSTNALYTQTVNGSLETTQQQVLSQTQAINNRTTSLDAKFDVNLSTRASENTQLQVRSELVSANASLDNIESYDLAIKNRLETLSTNVGATDANTLRIEANQGEPNPNNQAWPISITDGGSVVKVVKEEDQYSTSDHGLPIYGVDRSVNPKKYHILKVDSEGTLHTHLTNVAGADADFGAGPTTTATLRVSSNITRNGTELDYNDGASSDNTLRTSSNVKFDGTTPTRGAGATDATTQRIASNDYKHDGTNKDYNAGVTGVQTPRVTANITRNGTELSYNKGTSDTNTLRTASNITDSSGNDLNHYQNQLQVANILTATGTQGSITVGTTAVEVKVNVTILAGRKIVTVFNNSLVTIYWGRNNTVTTATGTPIFANQFFSFEGFSATQPIFLIAAVANNNVRITEN